MNAPETDEQFEAEVARIKRAAMGLGLATFFFGGLLFRIFVPKPSADPPSTDFAERLDEKRNLSVLVTGDRPIDGFKIGYERFRGVFFSWLGGVKTECQRRGVARALLQYQHRLCLQRGYHEIQTETFADGNGMLLLNLQEGFEIFGTHLGVDGRLRVQLRRMLLPNDSEPMRI